MGLKFKLALGGVFAIFATSYTPENVRSVQLENSILETEVLNGHFNGMFYSWRAQARVEKWKPV